jgi:sirohydrochlorin cobaltochelatase
MKATILFAHGARDPAWANPFIAIRDALRAAKPDVRCELAFLELMQPDLPSTINDCYTAGARHITVAPIFMAAGSHLKSDLPKLVTEVQARHPDLSLRVLPPIGEVPEISNLIAQWLAAQS